MIAIFTAVVTSPRVITFIVSFMTQSTTKWYYEAHVLPGEISPKNYAINNEIKGQLNVYRLNKLPSEFHMSSSIVCRSLAKFYTILTDT